MERASACIFAQKKPKTIKKRTLVIQYDDTSSSTKKQKNKHDENRNENYLWSIFKDEDGKSKTIVKTEKQTLKATGFSNAYQFESLRLRPRLTPQQFPDPATQELRFFIYDGEYGWSQEYGTLLRWYGTMEGNNASMYIQLHGFDPHFMIEFPTEMNEDDTTMFMDCLESALVNYLKVNFLLAEKKTKYNDELVQMAIMAENHGYSLIRRWNWKIVEPLLNPNQKGNIRALDVYLSHPKLVRFVRDLMEYPNGAKLEYTTIPTWCDEENELGELVSRCCLYEADVDFTIRWLVDNHYSPCHWYSLPPGSYMYIQENQALRCSECEVEILASCNDLKLLPDSQKKKLPDWTVVVFDEEWNNTGKLFPNPLYDDMLCIIFKVFTLNGTQKPLWILMRYGSVQHEADKFDYVFTYQNQVDFIVDVLRFLRIIGADVWQHHNGNHFDIPYPIQRARYLGIQDCDKLGRSLTKGVYIKTEKNKGWKKFLATIPGIINIDLLRRAQDDMPSLENHALNDLAKKFKIGMTKGELSYDRISVCQKTEDGRKLMDDYCKTDVLITDIVANEMMKTVKVCVEVARLSGISFNASLNRATTFKIEGALRHDCNRISDEKPPLVKITTKKGKRYDIRFQDKESYDRWKNEADVLDDLSGLEYSDTKKLRYKGATVLKPKKGYYRNQIVITLDFSSMYPSIIMRRNLCYSTLVSKDVIKKNGYRWKVHYWSLPRLRINGKGELVEEFDPDAPAFLMPHIKEGILPALEKKWKTERNAIRKGVMKELNGKIQAMKKEIKEGYRSSMTKEEIEKIDNNKDADKEWGKLVNKYINKNNSHPIVGLIQEYEQWDARQLAIKLDMNGLYGMTGFKDSPYYCPEIAETITGEGRNMLLRTKYLVQKMFRRTNGFPFDADVIYGDTDSAFVLLQGLPADPILGSIYGKMMAKEVTKYFQVPDIDEEYFEGKGPPYNPYINEVELTFEKCYCNLNLILAKNYAGLKFEIDKSTPDFDAKGLRMLKRGPSAFEKETLKKICEMISIDDNVEGAIEYAKKRLRMLRDRKVNIVQLIKLQRLSKDLNQYGQPKKYFCKKTQSYKTRVTGLTIGVVLARRQWEEQLNAAKELKYTQADMAMLRPPGAGTTIQYVMTEQVGKVKKKLKKSEMAMDPMEAIKNKAEIDFESYIEDLENNICTIMRHPINLLFPGNTTPKEETNQKLDSMFQQIKTEMDIDKDGDEHEKLGEEDEHEKLGDDEDEDEVEEVDISDRVLTPEDIKKEKKREDEIEKLLNKKVLRILYDNKPKPPVKQSTNMTKGSLNQFIPTKHRCVVCDTSKLDSESTSTQNKSVCKECTIQYPEFALDLNNKCKEKTSEMNEVWKKCEDCLKTKDREQLEECIAFQCPNMNARISITSEVRDLEKRIHTMDLSW